jgi:hypothetical protein
MIVVLDDMYILTFSNIYIKLKELSNLNSIFLVTNLNLFFLVNFLLLTKFKLFFSSKFSFNLI